MSGGCAPGRDKITPYEAFFGKKPTIAHMQVWYSKMFIHHPKSLSSGKLRECGQLVRFLGYPKNSAGYRAFDPNTHKVSIVRLPLFREEAHPTQNASFKMPGADYSSSEEAEDVPRQQSKVDAPLVMPAPAASTDSTTILQPSEGCPTRQRLALRHFDPKVFGPYGRRVEHIMNAYEDHVNNALFNDSMKEELAEI